MDQRSLTIEDLQKKLQVIEAEAQKIKTMINYFCELTGQPPMYATAEGSQSVHLRGDEYHGKPLATAITEVLLRRKQLGRNPCTVEEIFADLVEGSFDFEKKPDATAKKNVAISMGKNRKFYQLPNDKWGLREWYDLKDVRPTNGNTKVTEQVSTNEKNGQSEATNSDTATEDTNEQAAQVE